MDPSEKWLGPTAPSQSYGASVPLPDWLAAPLGAYRCDLNSGACGVEMGGFPDASCGLSCGCGAWHLKASGKNINNKLKITTAFVFLFVFSLFRRNMTTMLGVGRK